MLIVSHIEVVGDSCCTVLLTFVVQCYLTAQVFKSDPAQTSWMKHVPSYFHVFSL